VICGFGGWAILFAFAIGDLAIYWLFGDRLAIGDCLDDNSPNK
jgi:hypothetical protein